MQKREQQELLRQYLLRDLDEGRQEQLEEQLLTDGELQEALSDEQDSLIDDYVLELLTERERERFKSKFLLTQERLHKLRLAQSLAKYAEAETTEPQEAERSYPVPFWRQPLYFLKAHRLAAIVSSVVILLIVGYSGWSIYQQRRLENLLAEMRKRQFAVEQELARLNAGQLSEQPSAIATLSLKQLLVRDSNEQRRAVIVDGINILQLKLELTEDKFPSYRAVIEIDEGTGIFTISDLKAKSVGDDKAVFLNIPSRLLPSGNYQVHLSGMTPEKESVEVGLYPFQVILK